MAYFGGTGNYDITSADLVPEQGIQVGQGTSQDWTGGGGSSTTYFMRGWGTVSAGYVYWVGTTPDDSGAPEVVTDPVLMKEIN